MVRPSFSFLRMTTLAAILFGAVPGLACAQLAVSGPTPASERGLHVWYDAHVPTRFRARETVTVRQFTDRQMTDYIRDAAGDGDSSQSQSHSGNDGDGDIDGVFENDPPQITLRVTPDNDQDLFTFGHEYGHYVWFNLFSRDDRRRYEGLYKKQRAAHHLVTRYAATDVEEGFAEAFSFYVGEAPMLARRDPASYQFLNQWTGYVRKDDAR